MKPIFIENGHPVLVASDACFDCHTQSILHNLVQSVVSALESRDPHTAEHSLRVGDMTERTCHVLGLSAADTLAIHMAAHVHDIGKIGIPDAVLLKKSRLTPDEHALLRSHPVIGAEIIGAAADMEDLAKIVRHHHERWDGGGYPDGLRGTDIPRGARIVAVCDSIDAMLGKRMYRKSMDQLDCRREIAANSGVMYDPEIAQVVLANWDFIVGPVDFKDVIEVEREYDALRLTVPQTTFRLPA